MNTVVFFHRCDFVYTITAFPTSFCTWSAFIPEQNLFLHVLFGQNDTNANIPLAITNALTLDDEGVAQVRAIYEQDDERIEGPLPAYLEEKLSEIDISQKSDNVIPLH